MLSVVSEAAMDHDKLLKDPGCLRNVCMFKMGSTGGRWIMKRVQGGLRNEKGVRKARR